MKKNSKSFKQLLQLLKVAYQERDEARDQLLQKVLNKVMSSSPPEFLIVRPQIQPENSSITGSNSLSKTYNYHSHGSPLLIPSVIQ